MPPADFQGKLPAFLEETEASEVEWPLFVAREAELEKLAGHLDQALAGSGRVVFVTGEAGSGKTALVEEFARCAQDAHPELVVASGGCNAYTGLGDPYLPFREVLGLLTGDVESRWAAGTISGEHARRLWNTLPFTAQALVESSPDLIDTFIPVSTLLERAVIAHTESEWLKRLEELKETSPAVPVPQQVDLFEQYTRVLVTLARQTPLLLVLDDLQWADLGSISLLFHLGRRLAGSRILVVCAYRPEEVALGRDSARHPLETALHELQRESGELAVDMDKAERLAFVNTLLNSEPNQLDESFRDMLYLHTRGHPLYTIELLRGMQERGDLVQDQDGNWVEGGALDWETLPARVEAVVAERIDRLDTPLRAALRTACVEGEVFTAEVVANIRGIEVREMVKQLSSDLDRKHQLVRAHAIERLGSRRVSRYRFRHILVQKYLYDTMDELERAYLHEDVGNILEELYADQADEIAVQLARHFQEARITDKAIHYLYQAGHKAVQLSAYKDAIAHLDAGMALLMASPDSPERDQRELDYQLRLALARVGAKGLVPEVKQTYLRARELCQQLGNNDQLFLVLNGLATFNYVLTEYGKARQYAEESLQLAQKIKDPLLTAVGNWILGFILFSLGEYRTALDNLEEVNAFYDPEQHHSQMVELRGSDLGPSALAYTVCCLWCLGYPDQAEKISQDALELARKFNHPFTLVDTLCYAGCLFNEMRRDADSLLEHAGEMKQLAHEKVPGWLGSATWHFGEALAMLGRLEEGITQMHEGLALGQSTNPELVYQSGCLCTLGEAQAKAGQPEVGLLTLDKALNLVEQTGERYCEAELHRMRGELELMSGNKIQAEASFQEAIRVARQQEAKSWELRAATSLARLWRTQGKETQARELLADTYSWFKEGFDTPDLIEAKTLLDELAQPGIQPMEVDE
jgi:predicted ATPase